MRAVVQRVLESAVAVGGETVGQIGAGFLVLLCVMDGDTEKEADLLAKKTASLRVLEDSDGKMNLSLLDTGGAVLAVSQFTLGADLKKGNRPSFTSSASPKEAERLYLTYCEALRAQGVACVKTGVFGADMQVSLINDGPVTILLDTEFWRKPT